MGTLLATKKEKGSLLKKPTIIVVGAELGSELGVDVVSFIQQSKLAIKSIIYSKSTRHDVFERAMRLNVHGYIFVESGLSELLYCLSEVHQGRNYISPQAFHVAMPSTTGDKSTSAEFATLTRREIEIMSLIAQGLTNQESANQLSRSMATVNHHQNIMKKLNIQGHHHLLRQAIRLFSH